MGCDVPKWPIYFSFVLESLLTLSAAQQQISKKRYFERSARYDNFGTNYDSDRYKYDIVSLPSLSIIYSTTTPSYIARKI